MSFTNFVSRSSELHLLSAIQAIERALVGVQEHCIINYEVTTGCLDGGKVSANVAAGIDCLDLILESVSGRYYFISKVCFQILREMQDMCHIFCIKILCCHLNSTNDSIFFSQILA